MDPVGVGVLIGAAILFGGIGLDYMYRLWKRRRNYAEPLIIRRK